MECKSGDCLSYNGLNGESSHCVVWQEARDRFSGPIDTELLMKTPPSFPPPSQITRIVIVLNKGLQMGTTGSQMFYWDFLRNMRREESKVKECKQSKKTKCCKFKAEQALSVGRETGLMFQVNVCWILFLSCEPGFWHDE